MTPDDLQRVEALLEEVIARPPAERAAFLEATCADAATVRTEVESLLAAHLRDAGLLDSPAYMTVAELFLDQVEALAPGQTIGHYVIREELGRGGTGIVYRADDTRLARPVALKALLLDPQRSDTQRERLTREARAAAALSHPNVATVFALEEIDGQLYLASELVPGQTLRPLIGAGRATLAEVTDIGVQLTRALAAAHAGGVVHRDLKPENIVRTPDGTLKVLDFGLARLEAPALDRLTVDGTVLGTPGYMAPEQIRGGPVDFRTDLFAVGVILYELASGEHPFREAAPAASLARTLEHEPPPLASAGGVAHPVLERIVARCLQKEPAGRYETTGALVADLEGLQRQIESGGDDRATASETPAVARIGAGAFWQRPPRWWWEVHQVSAATVYLVLVFPVWLARTALPSAWRTELLLVTLAFGVAAASVRLHLWFTGRVYDAELPAQRAGARRWTRLCDAGFVATLTATGAAVGAAEPELAMVLIGAAAAIAVAAWLIEPATTRAAFRE